MDCAHGCMVLDSAGPTLVQERSLARQGRLPVDDRDTLGDYLVERLRYLPDVDRLYYGDQATGRFVIALRLNNDGDIVLGMSQAGLDGGRRVEWLVDEDGRREPLTRESAVGYDPRQRGWYQAAAAATDQVTWTDPYSFPDGTRGVTAALAWRDPDQSEPHGVFGADFRLADLSRTLGDFFEGSTRVQTWQFAAITRQGQLFASAGVPTDGPGSSALPAALAQVTDELPTLPLGLVRTFHFEADGSPWIAVLKVDRVAPGLDSALLAILPEVDHLEVVNESVRRAMLATVVILGLASVLGVLISRRITRPLRAIVTDLERIARFEITGADTAHSFVREIDIVSTAVGRMKASLRSFSHYVPVELVREVVSSGEEARLGGQTRSVTLFFSDIAGFTQISESMPPTRLVEHLGEYLGAMTAVIQQQGGAVDKFIGDGIFALFNAPLALPDHPAAACRAALRAQARLRLLNQQWEQAGVPTLQTRIGLHTGEAIVGNIGTPDRFEYTVMGDAVNLASRLEGLNKLYGTSIMVSQEVYDAAGPDFEWRALDRVAVVGRTGSALVYELLGERGQVESSVLRARGRYEQALQAYFQQQFAEAALAFGDAVRTCPEDRAAAAMQRRAADLAESPPSLEWDGVYRATVK